MFSRREEEVREPHPPFFVLSQTRWLALQPLFHSAWSCARSPGTKDQLGWMEARPASYRLCLAPSLTWSHWDRNSSHWPLRTLRAELSSAHSFSPSSLISPRPRTPPSGLTSGKTHCDPHGHLCARVVPSPYSLGPAGFPAHAQPSSEPVTWVLHPILNLTFSIHAPWLALPSSLDSLYCR